MFLARAEKLLFLTGELGGQAGERGARVEHWGPTGSTAPVQPSPGQVKPATGGHVAMSEPLDWGEPLFERGDGRAANVTSKASFGTSTLAGVLCYW